MKHKFLSFAAFAAMSAHAFPSLAQGQTVSDKDEYRLSPIAVTATRVEQPLHEIPMSVSALQGSRLDKANSFNGAEDLVEMLTGVQAAVANGTQIAFQIRGIGAVDHQALTPSAAAVYMDDVFLATNVQTGLMLYDLESVEVLKGPQGALFGRNASSGAINLLSARPHCGPEQLYRRLLRQFQSYRCQRRLRSKPHGDIACPIGWSIPDAGPGSG